MKGVTGIQAIVDFIAVTIMDIWKGVCMATGAYLLFKAIVATTSIATLGAFL